MAETPRAFAINSVEGAHVHVDDSSEDETFLLTVLKDGSPVEKHEGVTAESVGGLVSDHFSVEYIHPPAPEEE